MKLKLVKGLVAVVAFIGAVAMTYQSNPKAAKAEANAKPDQSKNDLTITSPEKPDQYGIGTYRVEGLVPKGSQVTLYLDRKELKTFQANTEDGSYLEDIDVANAGGHTLVAEYKDSKGERVLRKLEFKSSSDKNKAAEGEPKEIVANAKDDGKDKVEATDMLPEPDDVKYPEDPKDPNSTAHRVENGVKDVKKVQSTKPAEVAKKIPAKIVKPGAKAPFAISSYSNFNTVPHGLIQIGGKGKVGDKVLLLIDSKPSMKGTIKPNGRWKFPVKIATPGTRTITAKNLTTKEVKTIKLKIK